MAYQEPPWAVKPSISEWKLTEIKSGVHIADHELDRPCTLLGRAEDQVDIALQHESCSRQHARIAFDSTGTPWLRDLQSTHGTTVNKKRLPTQAIGKQESNSTKAGSRGVVLYPGDVIQFGASTRIFCVEGPADFARGAIRKVAVVPKSKQTMIEYNRDEPADDRPSEKGVSWGIDMNDETDSYTIIDKEKRQLLEDESKIPEKHRKEWERLRALKYKLENLQQESERIRRKGDLSEGQERQLSRNQERESSLQEQIQEKEEELLKKLYPDEHVQSDRADKERAIFKDEGEVEDRTKDRSDGFDLDQDGETEESLTLKWKTLHERLKVAVADMDDTQTQKSRIEEKLRLLKTSGDEEAFFVQNDLDLVIDAVRKLGDEQRKIEKAIAETKVLLLVVNPKLTVDESTGYVGQGEAPSVPVKSSNMSPPLPRAERAISSGGDGEFVMPPPSIPKPQTATAKDESLYSEPAPFMPPPKRKRVVGPSMPPPADTAKPKVRPHPMGTLAMLSTPSSGSSTFENKHDAKDRPGNKSVKQKEGSVDIQRDVWIPPEGQDGSGVTKLNAKFAGRY